MFSATSQPETLLRKRDNVSPYEQNKSIWLVENEMFLYAWNLKYCTNINRDNFCPYMNRGRLYKKVIKVNYS
jgi:hypothetical protein